MRYDPAVNDHGLARDPFVSLVVPRPIGWISTVDGSGTVNLAPYSFFNIVSGRPPLVMFSSIRRKDSLINAEAQGDFVASIATYDLRNEVNLSSADLRPGESEAEALGLEMEASAKVRPPRVKRSPIALECLYEQTIALPEDLELQASANLVLGRVVSIYIDDGVIVDGLIDLTKVRPISRLGYLDYGVIGEIFSLPRPQASDLQERLRRG